LRRRRICTEKQFRDQPAVPNAARFELAAKIKGTQESRTRYSQYRGRDCNGSAIVKSAMTRTSVLSSPTPALNQRWEELAEREGVDWAKTVAEIAGLEGLSADKAADRKVFRREILERVLKFKKR